ncbi:zinc ribbon domain-containing protein [Dysgonomonas capnocytophagoides]|uniref:zinc ribbon domain-containing protein n=1 Tax=Dysgonomonas capnocytophagoides TaxID=45254 RepID=UPI0039934923
MLNCSNCSQSFNDNDKLYFCPFCLTQLKCKQCQEILPSGAIGCISCGTPIVNKISNSGQINEIEFERKGDSIKFKTSFTNEVGKDLVSTFGSIAGVQQIAKRTLLPNSTFLKSQQNAILNSEEMYTEVEEIPIEDEAICNALNLILTSDGDKLIFQKNSFKEQNKLDKGIRISLLTLLGYKYLLKTDDIKRQILTDILKHYKLNSGGFRNWITKADEIGRKTGSIIFLTPDGKDKATEVLKEVLDKDITKGIIKFSKTSSGTSRKKSTAGNSDTNKTSSLGTKEHLITLIEDGYFKEHRTLGDIAAFLKEKKAITLTTAAIGMYIVKLLDFNNLEREKGESGQYEYFIR